MKEINKETNEIFSIGYTNSKPQIMEVRKVTQKKIYINNLYSSCTYDWIRIRNYWYNSKLRRNSINKRPFLLTTFLEKAEVR